ncbi:helix-turn-helix domain-containing protein [Bradyrhizobium diazoefficiens]|uniref:helix-turn-helix domain-containing protein n=1 Tax=Bradyrhizobium diazoefficiens TaxID=1355477 RepID=UPI001FEF6B89|nr:helix-turn-helix domain-containing protein [Bradyrhizobium diazoefficiens]
MARGKKRKGKKKGHQKKAVFSQPPQLATIEAAPAHSHDNSVTIQMIEDLIERLNTVSRELSGLKAQKPRRLATIKEACAYAKMGHSKLYEMINTKEITAYKRDGRTLVDLDSVDDMNNRNLVPW